MIIGIYIRHVSCHAYLEPKFFSYGIPVVNSMPVDDNSTPALLYCFVSVNFRSNFVIIHFWLKIGVIWHLAVTVIIEMCFRLHSSEAAAVGDSLLSWLPWPPLTFLGMS